MPSLSDHQDMTAPVPEPRARPTRYTVLLAARIAAADGRHEQAATVRNISATGLLLATRFAARTNARVQIALPHMGLVSGRVAWSEDGRMGIELDHAIDPALALRIGAEPAVALPVRRGPFTAAH